MKELTQFLQDEGFYDMTFKEKENIQSRIYVDFHNADRLARIRLNLASTEFDLEEQGIELKEGSPISMYQEQIQVDGIIRYSDEENIWVAEIDWWNIIEEESEVISD